YTVRKQNYRPPCSFGCGAENVFGGDPYGIPYRCRPLYGLIASGDRWCSGDPARNTGAQIPGGRDEPYTVDGISKAHKVVRHSLFERRFAGKRDHRNLVAVRANDGIKKRDRGTFFFGER